MLPKEVLNEDDPELQKPDEEAVNEVRSQKNKTFIKIVVFTAFQRCLTDPGLNSLSLI